LTSIQAEVIGQRADEVGAERSTRPFQGPASISNLEEKLLVCSASADRAHH
jgi:hypothetical protein